MYLGLFLIMPFVNMVVAKVYESQNKQMMWALILTSLLLTCIPTMVSRQGHIIVSRYWEMNFPVTFYIMGAYIRLYRPQLSGKWLLVALCLLSISLILNIAFRGGKPLISFTGAYYNLLNVIAIYIIFVSLYSIKSFPCAAVITSISIYSLEMYLYSYMLDKIIYPVFINKLYLTQSQFLLWFILITAIVLISSYILARITRYISDFIAKMLPAKLS